VKNKILITLAALCVWQSATAFWVTPKWVSGHATMTRDALALVKTNLIPATGIPEDQKYFSPEAIDALVTANLATDTDTPYSPVFHFDNEQFRRGSNFTIRTRNAIVRALMLGDQNTAWSKLGMALHGIQDLYAHSSWLERKGMEATAAHYSRPEGNDAARAEKFMGQIGNYAAAGCGANGVSLSETSGVTGAYYKETSIRLLPTPSVIAFSLLTDLPYPSATANPTKCVHLGPTVIVTPCAIGLDCFISMGFEKDNPAALLHAYARSSARRASQEFVQGIIDELEAKQDFKANQAVCLLLGRPTSLCMVPAAGLQDGVYFLRELCVYSITSYYQSIATSNSSQNPHIEESHQDQHSCIDSNTISISPGNLFCRRGGAWIPKTSVSTSTSSTSSDRRVITVTADGTFTGTYTRVTGAPSRPGYRIFDFVYYVQANATTHKNDAYLFKKDATISVTSSISREWYGMGSSNQANPAAGYGIDLVAHSSLRADQPLPSHCSYWNAGSEADGVELPLP